MPPTSSPWLKVLEVLGSGFPNRPDQSILRVGEPANLTDACNDVAWQRLVRGPVLFAAWSPRHDSPWAPYAKPTLFASLEGYRGPPVGSYVPPAPTTLASTNLGTPAAPASAPAPAWLPVDSALSVAGWQQHSDRTIGIGPEPWPGLQHAGTPIPPRLDGTAIILDLPGALSVAYAAWLSKGLGMEPVPLFNNWPHAKGVVKMESVLGALLHYACWNHAGLQRRGPKPAPVFLMDRDRMGLRPAMPGEFDNRYIHLDVDLPSPAAFKRNGINRLLYVSLEAQESDDLNRPFVDLSKNIPLSFAQASRDRFELTGMRDWAPAPRKTPYSTVRDPTFAGFRRNAQGGFGKLYEVSSGGGYG